MEMNGAAQSPVWAQGHDMEFLRACAAMFKAGMKQHTYGAFGLPKERDIAQAITEGSLGWTTFDGQLQAVAITKQLSRPSAHEDFAGRKATILPGDVYVRALAGSQLGVQRIVEGIASRSEAPVVWVEAHVEDFALVRLLEALGFHRVMTKISASSDLKGMFALVRDAREAEGKRWPVELDPADYPSARVIGVGYISGKERSSMLAEAIAADNWRQHYSSYNKRSSWTAFALRGFDPDDPGFIIKPAEMSKQWKAENPARLSAQCRLTKIAERFPTAMRVAARVPGEKERVRLMRLSSRGGELTRHADITDPDAGTRDGQLCRIHIPLQSDASCEFRTWDLEGREHRTHFPERGLCYLDTRKPHAVINPGKVERIHLVLDTFATPELRNWLGAEKRAASYPAAHRQSA